MEKGIKFRPNKPGSPHLNGMVERYQETDKSEFYAIIDLTDQNLDGLLAEWQLNETPYSDEVLKNYRHSHASE